MNEMRKKFEQLRFFQEVLEAKGLSKSEVDEFTKDYKREIRGEIKRGWKRARAIEVFDEYEIQSIDGESSTLIYKVESDSREEVEEYLKDEVVTITSQYDCSGQWFTTDIRFAHMQGDTYLVKHSLSMDVKEDRPMNMDRIKKAIIKKLKGYDLRRCSTYNEYWWHMAHVYGKMRLVHQIIYHFEGCSMVVDDVIYSNSQNA